MNYYLTTFFAVTVLTHLCLLASKAYVGEEYSFKRLWSTTDRIYSIMAGVFSLVPVALINNGAASSQFRVSVLVSIVILAAGIRLTVWRPAKLPMMAIQSALSSRMYRFFYSWAGAIVFGAVFGFLVNVARWNSQTTFLTDVPSKGESRAYLYLFAAIIALCLILFWRLRSGHLKKLPTPQTLRRWINYAWFVPAIVGLMIALIQNQTRNITLANRWLIVAVLAWIVIAELWILINVLPGAFKRIAEERAHFEEQNKLLKRKKRKRRK